MNSPITKKNGTDLLRLMDYCFKRGVVDSCEVGDNYAVQSWYDEMLHSGRYGLVGFPDEEFDWRRWRFIIHKWAREQRFPYACTDYIDGIRKAQGMGFVIVPMTMRFYLMGVGSGWSTRTSLRCLCSRLRSLYDGRTRCLRTW